MSVTSSWARLLCTFAWSVSVSVTASAAAQQSHGALPDAVHLQARLAEVQAMAEHAVSLCQQVEHGCQDVWCLTTPAFDAHVPAWPEALAVQVSCQNYHPDGDQSSVRELEPTLGDPYEFPRGGWTTYAAPVECGSRGERCSDVSVGAGTRPLAKLHVVLPYGDGRFVDAVVLLTRPPVRRHGVWTDPRPLARADAPLMDQHLSEVRQLAVRVAPICGHMLGEAGTSNTASAPIDFAATPLAQWPEWPAHLDVRLDCSHATSPSQTSGNAMAQHGSPTYATGETPWGPADARCIHPGTPCQQYTTFARDPHLVAFQVEVRTPGDRGFVWATVDLHVP